MNGNMRKRLAELRSQTASQTSEHILDGDTSGLDKSLLKIDTISRLLTILPQRKRLIDVSALLLVLCVLGLVAFLWITESKNNALQFDIKSDSLETRMREPWSLQEIISLDTGLIRIERMAYIGNPLLDFDLSSPSGECWLHIKADTAEIVRLEIDTGQNLSITYHDSRVLGLEGHGTPISGQVQLIGTVHLYGGSNPRQRDIDTVMLLEVPEIIDFQASDSAQFGPIINAAIAGPLVLSGLCIDSLVFGRLKPDRNGDPIFESSILGGEIRLTEVSTQKQLYKREPLGLNGIKGRIAELIIDSTLQAVFEGCVQEVNVEIKGARRNLAPSRIEYIYYNSRTTFLLSIFSSFWGLIWGIRKILFT